MRHHGNATRMVSIFPVGVQRFVEVRVSGREQGRCYLSKGIPIEKRHSRSVVTPTPCLSFFKSLQVS